MAILTPLTALRLERLKQNLTQAQLAHAAHVDQQLVSSLERGLRPSSRSDAPQRLADALGVSVAELWPEDEASKC